jgi:hypothetical protein
MYLLSARPRNTPPPSPCIWALLVSQDIRHLFVTPLIPPRNPAHFSLLASIFLSSHLFPFSLSTIFISTLPVDLQYTSECLDPDMEKVFISLMMMYCLLPALPHYLGLMGKPVQGPWLAICQGCGGASTECSTDSLPLFQGANMSFNPRLFYLAG